MLQEWAAIAQIIGVTMQGIDFATTRTSKKRKSPISEEMQALVGLLSALEAAMRFAEEWRASRINPEIDNT